VIWFNPGQVYAFYALLQPRPLLKDPLEVDRLMAEQPFRHLKLSSAASFRRNGTEFRRNTDGHGCGEKTTPVARYTDARADDEGRSLRSISDEDKSEPGLPGGFSRPVPGVPASNPLRCFALALYGPTCLRRRLDANEHAMLKRIAQNAAAVYAELENNDLRHKISILERKLSANGSARAKRSKRGE
jgi:hypothetical protein